jgi:hypothetical protein
VFTHSFHFFHPSLLPCESSIYSFCPSTPLTDAPYSFCSECRNGTVDLHQVGINNHGVLHGRSSLTGKCCTCDTSSPVGRPSIRKKKTLPKSRSAGIRGTGGALGRQTGVATEGCLCKVSDLKATGGDAVRCRTPGAGVRKMVGLHYSSASQRVALARCQTQPSTTKSARRGPKWPAQCHAVPPGWGPQFIGISGRFFADFPRFFILTAQQSDVRA